MNQSELDLIKEYLAYDPNSPSGLIWINQSADHIKIGDIAGTLFKVEKSYSLCYWKTCLKYKIHLNHRLVWMLCNNEFIPDDVHIDHISRDGSINLIENLRLDADNKNQGNRGINSNNSSQFPGVSFDKSRNLWNAKIRLGKIRLSKRFDDLESAANWYKDQHYRHFKEFSPYKPIPAL